MSCAERRMNATNKHDLKVKKVFSLFSIAGNETSCETVA